MNKRLDEDTFEVFLELKKAFRIAMAQTRAAIRELKTEVDPEFTKQARLEYLKGKMMDLIVEAWKQMDEYEDYWRRDKTVERLLTGEKIQATVKEIAKLQGEIIFLKKSGKANQAGSITPDMIERAKVYPMNQLIEIGRYNTLVCLFHADTRPSMKYYPDSNTVYCFSCNKAWDTIGFLIERDRLSFPEAIRRLQ